MRIRRSLVLITMVLGAVMLSWGDCQVSAYVAAPQLVPGVDYAVPNYANSPIIRKFVDSLPGLSVPGGTANNLNNYIPLAVPMAGSTPTGVPMDGDYYEIAVVDYTQQMHSDLPATKLRGYVQIEPPGSATPQGSQHVPLSYPNGAPITFNNVQVYGYDHPRYLGPTIVANRGKPTRIKFYNLLPLNASGGTLFIPTDTTMMGAGSGVSPTGMMDNYTENRATLHLHGGDNPWISDGTPHQWITPAGETSSTLLKGVSSQNVPDMPVPPNGTATFYYPNGQSGRLMFYHDHAYGITRLDVYAGEAAGYLVFDPDERALSTTYAPGGEIPLIIQDKTFVNAGNPTPTGYVPGTPPLDYNTLYSTSVMDPLWAAGPWEQTSGSLWFPHVYMPNQNPNDPSGASLYGRWDYGPWFWPIFPVSDTLPQTSAVPEAFMDTPVINGAAYPHLDVQPTSYRLRVLNATNDRFVNLQVYVADPGGYAIDTTGAAAAPGPGTFGTEVRMIPAVKGSPVTVTTPAGTTTTYLAAGALDGAAVTWPAGWVANDSPGMIPNILDSRPGGVPDPSPSLMGPSFIHIGSEGGIAPQAVVLPNTPIGYEQNKRSVTVLNTYEHTLFLGPAERADVVIDFSQYAGKTLIIYNDAPAPLPAGDPRNDYYTGDPDNTFQGGAPTTQPGFGPNTRTVMQIRVAGTANGTAINQAALNTAVGTAFNADPTRALIVAPNTYARISDTSMILSGTAQTVSSISVTGGGSGYLSTPLVRFTGGGSTGGASATATVVNGAVTSIDLSCPTCGGSYNTPPLVSLIGGNPTTTASAVAALQNETPMQPKTIQELFDPIGRMNAQLGVEVPFTTAAIQTTIPYGYLDPVTEVFPDGTTQLWKITHNGVDTHAIHFHLFNVQVVNRIGWDNAIKPPWPEEIGWKETVKMNPLEDIVVALKAKTPTVPFAQPNSIRMLDPTMPAGSTIGFFGVDPNNNPVVVQNAMANFGHEYVWHCHLLGHEENDMMRPMAVAKAPLPPTKLSVFQEKGGALVMWQDNSPDETGYMLQRKTGSTGAWTTIATLPAGTLSYFDKSYKPNAGMVYQVISVNMVGSGITGYPSVTAYSLASAPIAASVGLAKITSLTQAPAIGSPVAVKWTYSAIDQTGFMIERSTSNTFPANGTTAFNVAGNVLTFSDTSAVVGLKKSKTFYYRVTPTNAYGTGAPSNIASLLVHP